MTRPATILLLLLCGAILWTGAMAMSTPWKRLTDCELARWVYAQSDSTARRTGFEAFLQAGLMLGEDRTSTELQVAFTRRGPKGEEAEFLYFKRSILTGRLSTQRIGVSPDWVRARSVPAHICDVPQPS